MPAENPRGILLASAFGRGRDWTKGPSLAKGGANKNIFLRDLAFYTYILWKKNYHIKVSILLKGNCKCFHYRGLECKSRKSRNTWSNRKIWPWSTEWSRAMANRVLPREHTGHSKRPLPTTQEKTLYMDITRQSILKSDRLYSLQPKMEKLYTISKNKTRSWLWLRWTPYCQIWT